MLLRVVEGLQYRLEPLGASVASATTPLRGVGGDESHGPAGWRQEELMLIGRRSNWSFFSPLHLGVVGVPVPPGSSRSSGVSAGRALRRPRLVSSV